MIFTMNCTDALNMAFKGLLHAGDHVITTTLEHNSVSRPLQAMADAGFISMTRVEFSPQTGVIDPADVKRAIGAKTRLIALSHAGNVLGTVQPAAEVGHIAREHGVRFLLDTAQTMGVIPINVVGQHVDMLAFPGHKSLLGPTGTGGLYVHTSVAVTDLAAFREGGTGGDSSSPLQPRLFPYFLEGGTPNTVGVAGLAAATRYVHRYGPDKILAHERHLVQRFVDSVADIEGLTIYGPTGSNAAANRVGTVSFNVEGHSPHEIGGILDEAFSIAVRPGLHCSPYAHKQIGSFPEGTVRVSPGHFNSLEDIDALVAALREITA